MKKFWVPLTAAGLFLLTVAIMLFFSLKENQGHFVYALDDAYIHMAMAKNFVLHGIWGVTPEGFSSSTSAPFWVLLLSATYLLFGINIYSPLIINIICALLIIFLANSLLSRYKIAPHYLFFTLLGIIYFTSLPALTLSGMEHLLHLLLSLGFVMIITNKKLTRKKFIALFILTSALAITRYESLFLIFVAGIYLLARKQWRIAGGLATCAIIPIIIYGLVSIYNGWLFFPNSIMVKSNLALVNQPQEILNIFSLAIINNLFNSPYLAALLLMSFTCFVYRWLERLPWEDVYSQLLICAFASLLHLQFAKIGWFWRYEAYLIALLFLFVALVIFRALSQKTSTKLMILLGLFLLTCFLLLFRARIFLAFSYQSLNDRYLEHYYPAQFLAKYYNDQPILTNDIGMIAYYTNCKIVDIYSLANKETAYIVDKDTGRLRLLRYTNERPSAVDLAAWVKLKDPILAVLHYDGDLSSIPKNWAKVATWEVPRNVLYENKYISFFVIDPSYKKALTKNIRTFVLTLPKQLKHDKI
ncbi:MAG: hypothetical protein ABIH50_02920 [bacterium]